MISAEQEINGTVFATSLIGIKYGIKNSIYTVCCVHALHQLRDT